MLKTSFLAFAVCSLMLMSAPMQTSSHNLYVTQQTIELGSDKQSEANNKLKKALRPLLELKTAVEKEIPQKELKAIKQIAFKLFLVARKYL